MTDPQKDEHIEELLSKLQGIFGKLSHSEEEEANQKIEVSKPAPKETEKPETVPQPPKSEESAPEQLAASFNLFSEPPAPTEPVAAPVPDITAPAAPTTLGNYESTVTSDDPEKLTVSAAVYFPTGREAEAKSLAQKLETMTPKFTKVAFRLRVGVFLPYDPKSDWKDPLLKKAAEASFKTVFVVIDRALEETKRKIIAAELEACGVYFQEVPIASIEKKAFYTDILLGLVFFFDSHKPSASGQETTP